MICVQALTKEDSRAVNSVLLPTGGRQQQQKSGKLKSDLLMYTQWLS